MAHRASSSESAHAPSVDHPVWALRQGHYTPGLATAPLLFLVAIYLAIQLCRDASEGGSYAKSESEPPDYEL